MYFRGPSKYYTAMEGETDEESGWNCSIHPSVFFLLGTLVLTTCATGMLCASIMTDHWEEVTWDRLALETHTHTHTHTHTNTTIRLQWLLDGTVARLTNDDTDRPTAFLVPMHGGIWTLCVSLTEEDMMLLSRVGFPVMAPCVNYLAGAGGLDGPREEPKADWQHHKYQHTVHHRLPEARDSIKGMQNLSISCALVCLIVLGSAALVGAFGVCKHQISAVLVTGVMYLLAASFALFTLTIIHFKRMQGRPKLNTDCIDNIDGVVSLHRMGRGAAALAVGHLLPARIFSTSWSLDLGWGGVMLCVMTSVLWILLSKIMRFNPISSMIS